MNTGTEIRFNPWSWLIEHYRWARLSLPCGLVILTLLPLLVTHRNRSIILLVALLPLYMVHQYEEHAHGRFAAFVTEHLGHGRQLLSPLAIFIINIGEVWLLFGACFYLARFVSSGWGFVPVYLTLFNAIIHIATTLRMKRYNPGLFTAIVLLLPWSVFLLVWFQREASHLLAFNITGILAGVLGHAIIVAYALRQRSAA